jgi:hypothetical protein
MDREVRPCLYCILIKLATLRRFLRPHPTLVAVALRLTYPLVLDAATSSLVGWSSPLYATRPQRGRMELWLMRASGRLRRLVTLPYQLDRRATTRVSHRSNNTSRAATLTRMRAEHLPCPHSAAAPRASNLCLAPRRCSDLVDLAQLFIAGRPHELLRHRPLSHTRAIQHLHHTTLIIPKARTTLQKQASPPSPSSKRTTARCRPKRPCSRTWSKGQTG